MLTPVRKVGCAPPCGAVCSCVLAITPEMASRPAKTRAGISDLRTGISVELDQFLFLRPLHTLLMVLLPEPRPRPIEQVRHLVFDHLPRHDRRRPAVDRVDRLHALDELV